MAHDHAHIDPESGDRKVSLAIWANALLTVAQLLAVFLRGRSRLLRTRCIIFPIWRRLSSPSLHVRSRGARQMLG